MKVDGHPFFDTTTPFKVQHAVKMVKITFRWKGWRCAKHIPLHFAISLKRISLPHFIVFILCEMS